MSKPLSPVMEPLLRGIIVLARRDEKDEVFFSLRSEMKSRNTLVNFQISNK